MVAEIKGPFLTTQDVIELGGGSPLNPTTLSRLRKTILPAAKQEDRRYYYTLREAVKAMVWAGMRRRGLTGKRVVMTLREIGRFLEGDDPLQAIVEGKAVVVIPMKYRTKDKPIVLLKPTVDRIVELSKPDQFLLPLGDLCRAAMGKLLKMEKRNGKAKAKVNYKAVVA